MDEQSVFKQFETRIVCTGRIKLINIRCDHEESHGKKMRDSKHLITNVQSRNLAQLRAV